MRFLLKAPVEPIPEYFAQLRRAGVLLTAFGNSWIIQVKSREEAQEWARRAACGADVSEQA